MWLFTGIMFAVASLATSGMVDPRVLTLPSKVIVKGTRDSLPCQFEGTASGILWSKINSRDQISNIAVLQNGVRSGPGIDNGRFNISDDFSLVIYEVTVEDERTYRCEVAEKETYEIHGNNTDVTVIAYAEHPILRIPQCQNTSDNQGLYSQETVGCSVGFTASQQNLRLGCAVVGFKPNISLYWINETTNEKLGDIQYVYSTRSDGTYDFTASVKVNKRWVEDGGIVSCRADGMAVNGTTGKTVTIYVIPDVISTIKPTDKSGNAGIIAICIVAPLVLVGLIIWWVYKRKRPLVGEILSYFQKHHTCVANTTSQPVFVIVDHGAGESSSMFIDSQKYEAFPTRYGFVKISAARNKKSPPDCHVTDNSDQSYIVKQTTRGDLQLVHSDYGNVWKEGIKRK